MVGKYSWEKNSHRKCVIVQVGGFGGFKNGSHIRDSVETDYPSVTGKLS